MPRVPTFDRAALLERAMGTFWENGFSATGIRDLCTETGVAPTSLYNSFGDKEGLFVAVLDHYLETRYWPRLKLVDADPSGLSAIKRALDNARTVHRGDPVGCLIVNTALEMGLRHPAVARRLEDAFIEVQRVLGNAVARAQQSGEIPPEKDPEKVTGVIFSALVSLRVLARLPVSEARLDSFVDGALDAIT